MIVRPIVVFALAAVLFGCSTTLSLQPRVGPSLPSLIRVPVAVGIYYPPEFRGYEHEDFALGSASVSLFDSVYPRVFASAVPVKARTPSPAPRVAAVIEPEIEAFHFRLRPGLVGEYLNYWADITYRFTLYSPGGDVLTSWTVKGFGETSSHSPPDQRMSAKAVELAMQDAATKFMTSFYHVPEAKRWLRGLPTEGATAPVSDQKTDTLSDRAVFGEYEGVVSIRAEFDADLNATGVVPIRLSVKNKGHHRLLIRPTDIVLVLPDGTAVDPAPASAFAVAVMQRRGRLPILGAHMLTAPYDLFATFVNAWRMGAEDRDLAAHLTRHRTEELKEVTLWEGESTQGFVYFILAPFSGLSLTVPVVDIDAATRYIVRFPLH